MSMYMKQSYIMMCVVSFAMYLTVPRNNEFNFWHVNFLFLRSFIPLLQPILPPVAFSNVDLERLERVEHQLALLWERVQQGDQKQEERHGNVLGLYSTLKEQLHTQTDRESLGLWVSSLLEQRLGVLRGELERDNTQRTQVWKWE